MKTLYVIPGYKHNIKTSGYSEIINSARGKGIKVIFMNISWKYRVMSDYINQAERLIKDTKNTGVLGFSFGAMIALRLSQKYKFNKVFLCSLSPYFSEDLVCHPRYYKYLLGIKRWKDFEDNYSELTITNNLANSYVLIYGGSETESLQVRAKKIIQILNIKDISILEGVGHDISNKLYLSTIKNKLGIYKEQ